jgi:hypothetical protein
MGYLWVTLILNFMAPGLRTRAGLLKGADFLHFYTLGAVARTGEFSALYDIERLHETSQALVPESKGMRYMPAWGPQIAALFAPLAALSYGSALVVWYAVTLILYAACGRALWRRSPALARDAPMVVLLAALSPALHSLIGYGQTSILAFAAMTLAYLGFHVNRPFLAGAAIGLLAYKPQLGIASAVVFVACGDWRVAVGALVTGLGQVACGWLIAGTTTMRAYVETLIALPGHAAVFEPFPHEAHSLFGFFRLLLPQGFAGPAAAIAALPLLIATIVVWRSAAPLPVRFMALVLATLLVSPHLLSYDLVLALTGLLPLWGWLRTQNRSRAIRAVSGFAFLVYFSPAILAAKLLFVQPTTVSMLLLLGALTWLPQPGTMPSRAQS